MSSHTSALDQLSSLSCAELAAVTGGTRPSIPGPEVDRDFGTDPGSCPRIGKHAPGRAGGAAGGIAGVGDMLGGAGRDRLKDMNGRLAGMNGKLTDAMKKLGRSCSAP